ncbi:MAG: CPBP family intramembrane metalloprotease [Chloroflexota bacterium]|nr:CPBP family intramembrane metalloprotease [Chloroflexota bacterium]
MALGLALALGAGLILVVVIVLAAVLGELGEGAVTLLTTGLLGVAMALIVWLLGPTKYRASIASLGLGRPRSLQPFLWAAAALGASLAFNLAYVGLVTLFDKDFLLPQKLDLGISGPWWIAAVAMIVFWGPVTEELFFRGFVFAGLVGRWGAVTAGIVSALLFGVAHGAVGVMLPATFTGLLLAALYYRTRSLWACFLAHAAQNALALSVMKGV